jgi:ankyrin repeat protein
MNCAVRSVVWLSVASCLGASVAMAAARDLRLVDAVAAQDRVAVRMLVKEGVDVNVARADGATALLYAAHWNDLETVELLLQAGARADAADDHGVTALSRACENGNLGMVQKLLSVGANPNKSQTSGLTPLMIVARTGHLQILHALLKSGAEVNAATAKTKNTALMWAVADGHPDVVAALLEARADVHASTAKGWTPLMMAARRGDVGMAKTLLAAGVSVDETGLEGSHVLPFSVALGQTEFAQFLLQQGANPNGTLAGLQALHIAVANVGPWLAEWRQKHGAASRGRELTPTERSALVTALLARGADVNARIEGSGVLEAYIAYPREGAFDMNTCGLGDIRGATPLWLAAHTASGILRPRPPRNGDPTEGGRETSEPTNISARFVKMLLAAGADQRVTTDDGTTALMAAAGLGRCTDDSTNSHQQRRGERSPAAEESVTLLIDAGADVNQVNEGDFTALHGAAFRGLNEVIQILVDRGARIDARDFRGRTAYRLVEGSHQGFGYFQEYPETAEFMKKLGANTALGLPGLVQGRLRDISAANQEGK